MVPGAGIEPARPQSRGILSPLCLPISPPGRVTSSKELEFVRVSFSAERILTPYRLFYKLKFSFFKLLAKK